MSLDSCSDFSSSSLTLPTTDYPLSLPIPLQLLQIQLHSLHLMSPPPSLLLKHRPSPAPAPNPSPQPEPEISSETSVPASTLRVPGLYPDFPKSPPRTQSGRNLKQETSPPDPAPSPAPLLPLWEVAGAEGVVWVHGPFPLTDLSQIEKHLDSLIIIISKI